MQIVVPRNRSVGLEHRIIVATISRAAGFDGIADYSDRLVESLTLRGDVDARIANPQTEPIANLIGVRSSESAGLTIFLQYNPFNFGRWGFAPWLPAKLWRLKRQRPRPRIALMVHETYVTAHDWRTTVMRMWQRLQFACVHALSDVAFTSISVWAQMLRRRSPSRPVHHLPVGSNLPDQRAQRAAMRACLGVDSEAIVLAAFGTAHENRLMEYVKEAAAAVAQSGRATVLLNLGAGAPALHLEPHVRVVTPGALLDEELSRHLAAADVYLAPFTDGLSTRRTTLMAALQHGLPVVGTDGPSTDPMLRDPATGILLVPVGHRSAFARTARALASDETLRAARAIQARALYEREFDWSIISDRLVRSLESAEGPKLTQLPRVRGPRARIL